MPTVNPSPSLSLAGPLLHYVDGEFRASRDGGVFVTSNPVTGDPIAEVAQGLDNDVDLAVRAARRAFDDGEWRHLRAAERAAAMRRIGEAISAEAEEFVQLECLDIGMPIRQMRGLAARAAEYFKYYGETVTELQGAAYAAASGDVNYTFYKPVGVAALITPWNAPLLLTCLKLAPALATGNTCVLKPAEWSPLSANRLAEVLHEVGLPRGVFNVVHGFGETCGAPLVSHPGVNLISFTGETATGKLIMANAASGLKRCSLELGGKSPVIVFADCDKERAVDAIVFQIFSQNGQRCTAGSRLLAEQSVYDEIVDAVAARARAISVGDPFAETTEVGPLISPEHHERVLGLIDGARRDGARVVAGGARPDNLQRGNFLMPTVLADVGETMDVFQQEIFGPVLVASPFRDEAEAIRLANATQYGLAGYVWTRDLARAHRVAHGIDSGRVWVNTHNVADPRVPIGGMKSSGIGREGGRSSFEFYCEPQTVHIAVQEHPLPRLGAQ